MLGVLENLLDVLGCLLLREQEDLLGLFARQLLDDVGGVLRGHLVQVAGALDLVEGADERQQRGVVQGRQDVAGPFGGEPPEERDLLLEGQVLENRGDVRRVGRLERLVVAAFLAALEQAPRGVEQPLLILLLIAHGHRVRPAPSFACIGLRRTSSRSRWSWRHRYLVQDAAFGVRAGPGRYTRAVGTDRPDPEALLARVKAEEARQRRGKLKIFLGAAAGVGKTYAMLEAVREQKADGVDVLVGYVSTHGRAETDVVLQGLDILPARMVDDCGTSLRELDLYATHAHRPI